MRKTPIILLLLVLALMLTSCDAGSYLATLIPQPTDVLGITPEPTISPSPELAQPTNAVPPTPDGPQVLTIWLPPQFNPENENPSAMLLRQRLDQFQREHPDVRIEVRVKALSGPGGLLESLTTTHAAAPSALPALIALPRTDLENAALKGLVYPLDNLSSFNDDADWYDYARELAQIQNSTFGLPFGGDALLFMYRPEAVGITPDSWASIQSLGRPVIFPAADTQALVTLALYQSAGGEVEDAQHRPALDPAVLAEVLRVYSDGARNGSFPAWLTQYQTDGQAWQAFQEDRGGMLLSWSSRYLAELPADTSAVSLPVIGSEDYTMANGWVWAVTDPALERHELVVRLAEYLVESDYMAEWSVMAGYLPTRPTATASWQNQGLKNLVNRVALSARVRPANDLVASLGPVLQTAVTEVIRNQADPILAAEAAAEQISR